MGGRVLLLHFSVLELLEKLLKMVKNYFFYSNRLLVLNSPPFTSILVLSLSSEIKKVFLSFSFSFFLNSNPLRSKAL